MFSKGEKRGGGLPENETECNMKLQKTKTAYTTTIHQRACFREAWDGIETTPIEEEGQHSRMTKDGAFTLQ